MTIKNSGRNLLKSNGYSIFEQLRKDRFLKNRMGFKKYPNSVLST